MGILEEIRKEKITSNWFMNQDNWYKFVDGALYTQDKSKTGPESIVEITNKIEYDRILSAYKRLC